MPCKECNTYICSKSKGVSNAFKCEELIKSKIVDKISIQKVKEI